ncbi:MAG: hypothetical protein KJ888_21015, partial [Gammaproteobacteria bacterium]|nr:hypothetical protein [Gammaproteobacteria bacterium]
VAWIEEKKRAKFEAKLEAQKQEKELEKQAKECQLIMTNQSFQGFQEYLKTLEKECDDLMALCGRADVTNEQVISIVRTATSNRELLRRLRERPREVIEAYTKQKEVLGVKS